MSTIAAYTSIKVADLAPALATDPEMFAHLLMAIAEQLEEPVAGNDTEADDWTTKVSLHLDYTSSLLALLLASATRQRAFELWGEETPSSQGEAA